SLQSINLTGTRVTGKGIKHVAAIPTLNNLIISRAQVIDDVIRAWLASKLLHIYSMARNGSKAAASTAQIDRLFLMQTQVTDETLRALADLKSLTILNVRGTKVTDQGVA